MAIDLDTFLVALYNRRPVPAADGGPGNRAGQGRGRRWRTARYSPWPEWWGRSYERAFQRYAGNGRISRACCSQSA